MPAAADRGRLPRSGGRGRARPGARGERAGCPPPPRAGASRRLQSRARDGAPAIGVRHPPGADREPAAQRTRTASAGRGAKRPGRRSPLRPACARRTRAPPPRPGRATARRRGAPARGQTRRPRRSATACRRRPTVHPALPPRARARPRAPSPARREGGGAGRAPGGTARAGSRTATPTPTRPLSQRGCADQPRAGVPPRAGQSCPGRDPRPRPACRCARAAPRRATP